MSSNEVNDKSKIIAELERATQVKTISDISVVQKIFKLSRKDPSGSEHERKEDKRPSEVERSFDIIQKNILSDLSTVVARHDPKVTDSLNKNVKELIQLTKKILKQCDSETPKIEARLSIVQPHIKLVDANLAYKFAELQSNGNRLESLASLFAGIAITCGISFFLFYFKEPINFLNVSIYALSSGLNLIFSIVLWIFARQYRKKSEEAKKLLESDPDLRELGLPFADNEVRDTKVDDSFGRE